MDENISQHAMGRANCGGLGRIGHGRRPGRRDRLRAAPERTGAIPDAITHADAQTIPDTVTHAVTQAIAHTITHAYTQTIAHTITHAYTQTIPDTVTHAVTQAVANTNRIAGPIAREAVP